jgi:hypothetical protein
VTPRTTRSRTRRVVEDVGRDGDGVAATLDEVADDLLGVGTVDVGDDHRRPDRGEALGDESAGACPGAGHDRDGVLDLHSRHARSGLRHRIGVGGG